MFKSNNSAAVSSYETPAMEILNVVPEYVLNGSVVLIDDLDDVNGEWDI